MAYGGSSVMLVLLLCPSLMVHATGSDVHIFDEYEDESCSNVKKTEYLKEVAPGCYAYANADGDVANGASSFAWTCSDGVPEYTQYETGICTGATLSSGTTDKWFVKVMCSIQASPLARSEHGTDITSKTPSSCTRARLPASSY
jgi:hypothetical protein